MAFLANLLVKIGVDTSEVNAGLSKGEKAFKKFADSLQTTGKTMAAAISVPLLGIGAAAFKAAMDFNEASDTIRAQTGAMGADLRGMEEVFRGVFTSVPASAADATQAIIKLNQGLGLSGEPLKRLSTDILNVSRMMGEQVAPLTATVTRAFNNWGVSTGEQGAKLNFLYLAARATGVGIAALAEEVATSGPILRAMGFSFEQSAAMLAKFSKEGIGGEIIVRGFSKALATMAKEGIKDPSQALALLIDRVKAAGTESEATALLLDDFGSRAAPRMAAAIREGRMEIVAFVKELLGIKDSISTAAKETLDFADKLTIFRNQAEAAFEPLGAPMLETLSKLLDDIKPKLEAVGQAMRGLSKETRETIVGVGVFIATIPLAVLGLGLFLKGLLASTAAIVKVGAVIAPVTASLGLRVAPGFMAMAAAAGAATPVLAALAATLLIVATGLAAIKTADAINALMTLRAANRAAAEAEDQQRESVFRLAVQLQQHGVDLGDLVLKYVEHKITLEEFAKSLHALAAAHHKVNKAQKEGTRTAPPVPILDAEEIKKLMSALGMKNLTAEAQEAQSAFNQLRAAGVLTGNMLHEGAVAVAEAWRKAKDQVEGVIGLFKRQGKLATEPFLPSSGMAASAFFGGGTDTGEIDSRALFDAAAAMDRANKAAAALSDELRTGMYEAAFSTYRAGEALKALGVIGEQVRSQLQTESISEMFKEMNMKSTGELTELASAAKFRLGEIAASASVSRTDILRAEQSNLGAQIALYRDYAYNVKKEDRDKVLAIIRGWEKTYDKNAETLNKISGDTQRHTRDMSGFWRKMGAQVSTIITDLSRNVIDLLWPRAGGAATNADAITALGIAAGVAGDQLKALSKAVENLALATGQSFGSVAEAVGKVFGSWKVAIADQIPLLNTLYNVVRQTGIGLDDLLKGLNDGSAAFIALGWSASESAAFLGNLKRQGVDTTAVVGALNTALKNLQEQGFVDPQKALRDLIRQIKEAGSESEATAIAVRYFGSSGQEMAKVIRSGSFDLASFNGLINASAEDMLNAAAAARALAAEHGKLRTILDEVGRAILRAFAEAGMAALVDWLKESIKLKDLWHSIVDVFKTVADWLGIIHSAAKTATGALSQLPDWLGGTKIGVPAPGGGTVPTGGGGGGATTGGGGTGDLVNPFMAGWTIVMDSVQRAQMSRIEGDVARIEVEVRQNVVGRLDIVGQKLDTINSNMIASLDRIISATSSTARILGSALGFTWVQRDTAGGWEMLGPSLFAKLSTLVDILSGNTATGSAFRGQLAFAGGGTGPAKGGGDTFNIYINGASETAGGEAMALFREGARVLRARGIRHTTGVR